MATEIQPTDPELEAFDADEDLFAFEELYDAEAGTPPQEEIDLEEFLKGFAAPEPASDRLEEVLDGDLKGTPSPTAAPDRASDSAGAKPAPGLAALPIWACWAAAAVMLLQLAMATALWSAGREARRALDGAERHLSKTAQDLMGDVAARTSVIEELTRPLPLTTADIHEPGFQRVRELYAQERFDEGRRRLYAALAVIDRHPDGERELIEGRAGFLLADGLRLQAEARGERP